MGESRAKNAPAGTTKAAAGRPTKRRSDEDGTGGKRKGGGGKAKGGGAAAGVANKGRGHGGSAKPAAPLMSGWEILNQHAMVGGWHTNSMQDPCEEWGLSEAQASLVVLPPTLANKRHHQHQHHQPAATVGWTLLHPCASIKHHDYAPSCRIMKPGSTVADVLRAISEMTEKDEPMDHVWYQGLSERREDGVVTVRLGSHDD